MSNISEMLKMNYEECCTYLKNKYGTINGPYYLDKECKRINSKIKRGKDGLYIHHIDEDKAIMLSTTEYAIKNSYSYQLGERLVYCNLLEHLVLHIKIVQFPNKDKNLNEEVGVGGIFNFIIPELNDIYSGIKYKQNWKIVVADLVVDEKDDYFLCLKFLMSNFNFPLSLYLTSFNHNFGIWSIENNLELFKEIHDLYMSIKK